jgi:hypothetical protein
MGALTKYYLVQVIVFVVIVLYNLIFYMEYAADVCLT